MAVGETAVAGWKLSRHQDLVSSVFEAIDQTGQDQSVDQAASSQSHGLVGGGGSVCDLDREGAKRGVEAGGDAGRLVSVEDASSGGSEESRRREHRGVVPEGDIRPGWGRVLFGGGQCLEPGGGLTLPVVSNNQTEKSPCGLEEASGT